jgi:hypothetical protein
MLVVYVVQAVVLTCAAVSESTVLPSKGRDGYARFLQIAVLANNLITLGRLLWEKDDPDALPARTKRHAA